MTIFIPGKDDFVIVETKDGKKKGLKKDVFDNYSPSILGLGDVKKEATAISSIVAIFDLKGFTTFCKQMEPELSVPIFLSAFLDWIFKWSISEHKSVKI